MNRQTPEKSRRASPSAKGFSLLELFLTMVIIFILMTIYLSSGSPTRQRKLKAECEQNLSYVYSALQTYATDNTNAFPVVPKARTSDEPLSLLVPRYTTRTAHFICPGASQSKLPEAKPFKGRRISYAYFMGQAGTEAADRALMSDAQVNDAPKAKGSPVFSPDGKKPGNNHDRHGGVVLFCDGHAEQSGAKASFDILFPTNVALLNPRP